MTKTVKGGLLIAWPIVGLPIVLSLYAISSYIMNASIDTQAVDGLAAATPMTSAAAVVRIILGLLGLLCIVGGPISVVVGIVVLAKKDDTTTVLKQ